MKKTIKTIALKDIKLTGDFIIHLREKHGTGLEFGKEMARLTGLGVLQKGEMPKVSEEKLKKLMLIMMLLSLKNIMCKAFQHAL